MKRNSKAEQKQIAKERIEILFKKAKTSSQSLANRYVTLARKLSMKTRTPLPKVFKRKFCKHCHNYFKAGNYRVRTHNGKVVYYCYNCKKNSRIPFTKEKSKS